MSEAARDMTGPLTVKSLSGGLRLLLGFDAFEIIVYRLQ
jgi:hypothetical protein